MAMKKLVLITFVMTLVLAAAAAAQQARRPASPEGTSATQVNGRWIEIVNGRPILRGRTNIFGSGADYGQKLNDGGPVWRAGANNTTLLKTEAPLEIGGRRIEPGEYAVLIELKSEKDWTFILSTQPRQAKFDPKNTTELFGGYNYKPDRDVARAPMRVEAIPFSVDQLTWGFSDVTPAGGTMRIWWEKAMASVPFKILS
jgi:hypothetical protein